MIITTVTDEVLEDRSVEEVFKTGVSHGVHHFEIRGVNGKRFPLIDYEDFDILKRCKKEYGITYTAVSPGIFKVSLYSEEFDYHKGELFKKTMDMAEKLDINRIIIFGVKRSEEDKESDFDRIVNELGNLSHEAERRGFTILVENEPGWWADTSDNCFRILKAVNMNSFRLNWDPGNLFNTGEFDYKRGYELLKPYIGNVHLKDAFKRDGKVYWAPLGQGEINYRGQIEDLKKDGYEGNMTIETHCSPMYDGFKESLRYLKDYGI